METHLVEYKQSWSDEYLEWIAGYASAEGGTLYIGKDDVGNTIGVKNAKKLSEDIPNKIKSSMGIVPSVSLLQENGLWYVKIDVPPVNQIITYHGKVYYRSGSTKQTLDGPALTTFIMNKFNMSFDSLTIDGLSVDDFDNDAFRAFKDEAIHNNRMAPEERGLSKLELMEKLHLIKDGKITYAGMLMFYQDPERYIPACYTKVGYFKDGADLRYMDDIHGPLVKQVMQTIDILYAKYFRSYEEFEGVRRITHYQYPKDVIREAVCNAIIHRNYAQCNMVQIKVFPDKVMLFNNCIFPNGWTIDNLLKPHESKAINPLVAYAFYMMGYIDTWGRGIDKIVGGLKSVGQEEPVFEETKYSFCLSMKPLFVADEIGNATDESQNGPGKAHGFLYNSHELPSNFLANFLESFTENDAKVIEMIAENGRITAKEAASRIGISDRAVRSIIKKLKGCGVIRRVGPDKGGYWEVIIDEE